MVNSIFIFYCPKIRIYSTLNHRKIYIEIIISNKYLRSKYTRILNQQTEMCFIYIHPKEQQQKKCVLLVRGYKNVCLFLFIKSLVYSI